MPYLDLSMQVQVVDVRGDDFAGGHVKGAVNIRKCNTHWLCCFKLTK